MLTDNKPAVAPRRAPPLEIAIPISGAEGYDARVRGCFRMAKITVIGNDQRREYELGAINTVGRHPDNTLQILDRIVSKEHAQIVRQPDGRYLFRDLGSLNGSFLRGDRMSEH